MFKFAIGEVVYLRIGLQGVLDHARLGRLAGPNSFVVVEQQACTCPGGTQLVYLVGGEAGPQRFNEPELAALSEFDVNAVFELFSAALDKKGDRKAKFDGSTPTTSTTAGRSGKESTPGQSQ